MSTTLDQLKTYRSTLLASTIWVSGKDINDCIKLLETRYICFVLKNKHERLDKIDVISQVAEYIKTASTKMSLENVELSNMVSLMKDAARSESNGAAKLETLFVSSNMHKQYISKELIGTTITILGVRIEPWDGLIEKIGKCVVGLCSAKYENLPIEKLIIIGEL